MPKTGTYVPSTGESTSRKQDMDIAFQRHLQAAIQEALRDQFGYEARAEEVLLRPTPKHFKGQLTCVLFRWAKKISNHTLPQIGVAIGEALLAKEKWVATYEVVEGFLNIDLQDGVWLEAAAALCDRLPTQNPAARIVIEYSSPNTNKPLHLGHMRTIFLGDSMARILEALGHDSYRVSLVNDRGIHICKSMAAYLNEGGEARPTATCKGDHFVGRYYVRFEELFKAEISKLQQQGMQRAEAVAASPMMQQAQHMLRAWERGDKEVRSCWEKLNGWVYEGFEHTYSRLGIRFDKTYYESAIYHLGKHIIEEGIDKGLFYKRADGAVVVDMTEEGLGEKVLLRADGTSVYITQDLATADLKHKDYAFDASLYVVGDEQDYHFKVLFAVLKRLGRDYADHLRHISYGMVDLPSGKMKSREGTVVDADSLLDEMEEMVAEKTKQLGKTEDMPPAEQLQLHKDLALGALKYFLLKVHPSKRILFDPKASLDLHAATGTFVQYTYARICALLRRATAEGVYPTTAPPPPKDLQVEEQALIMQLLLYDQQIVEAAAAYDPSVVAQYVYELARCYNRWYETHPIFRDTPQHVQNWRLWVCARSQWRLQHGLGFLGIAAPTRM